MTADITYVKGDATAPIGSGPAIITHICNDAGGWGRGFVVALSKCWSAPEAEYRRWHRDETFGLGKIQVVTVAPVMWVANMIAQHGTKWQEGVPPIRYEALEECLTAVAIVARTRSAEVHMPRIGCGLAGGDWSNVGPIVQKTLCANDIAVTVYDFEET